MQIQSLRVRDLTTLIVALGLAMTVPLHAARSDILGTSIKGSIWTYDKGEHFGCKSQYPIAITVSNRSFSEIVRVTFTLELWLNERTTSVLKDEGQKTFDKLIPAFSSRTLCFTDTIFKEAWKEAKGEHAEERLSAKSAQGRNLLLESVQRINRYNDWYKPFARSAVINATILAVEKR